MILRLFHILIFLTSTSASSKSNELVISKSFQFISPECANFLKNPIDFNSSKMLYESKKKRKKGKKLLLSIMKDQNHQDYEMTINYAGRSLSRKLFKIAKKNLVNIFGTPGSLQFLDKSYAYFKRNDSSFLYLEAFENLACLASNPRFFFDCKTKLQSFIATKILQERDMLPKGSFGEFFLERTKTIEYCGGGLASFIVMIP